MATWIFTRDFAVIRDINFFDHLHCFGVASQTELGNIKRQSEIFQTY